MKRAIAAFATAGLMLGLAASPASAAPGRNCPPGFRAFIPITGDEGADHNGDGLICVVFLRNSSGGNSAQPGVVIIDNNAP
jgi:hypothetical protein